MSFHPHLHCILSAGGWHDTKQTWIKAKKLNSGFFIPQKVLAACFKKHFLVAFSQLWEQDNLLLPKDLMHLNNPDEFRQFYRQIAFKKNWIVKIMPPLDNPKRVIDYLGRYVYRIAITDSRIKEVKIKERQVVFEYKDYAAQTDQNQPPLLKTLTLDAIEFIRRFAQHVLPKGFQKDSKRPAILVFMPPLIAANYYPKFVNLWGSPTGKQHSVLSVKSSLLQQDKILIFVRAVPQPTLLLILFYLKNL